VKGDFCLPRLSGHDCLERWKFPRGRRAVVAEGCFSPTYCFSTKECREMRLKFIASAVAALAAVFGIHGAAQADHGGCGASAVVACCPAADCCQPKVRYKKEWQTVVEQRTKTCYKTVSRTVMKEVCQVVCRPVQEQKEVVCKRIVCHRPGNHPGQDGLPQGLEAARRSSHGEDLPDGRP
jgi:hypothetical protein